MSKKICMIHECEKRDDCWTNISSPGFVQRQGYRGYLETRRQGLSVLRGLKKNSMRLMRNSSSESLRQEGALDTGFIMRGCENLSGGGSPKGIMSWVRESEDRKVGLARRQSLLHKEVCLLCRQEVPCNDHTGCVKGTQVRLAYSKGIGQRIHGETTPSKPCPCSTSHWHRRGIHEERSYLSDSSKRFREASPHMVWGQGQV